MLKYVKFYRFGFISLQLIICKIDYEFGYSKTGEKFRSLLKLDGLKICEFLNGTENKFFKDMFKKLGDEMAKALHSCPYVVSKVFKNI